MIYDFYSSLYFKRFFLKDNDGRITNDELEKILIEEHHLSKDAAKKTLNQLDTDNDNKITFEGIF